MLLLETLEVLDKSLLLGIMIGTRTLVMVASAARAICDIVGDGNNILLSVVDRMTIKTKNATVLKNKDDIRDILFSPSRTEI